MNKSILLKIAAVLALILGGFSVVLNITDLVNASAAMGGDLGAYFYQAALYFGYNPGLYTMLAILNILFNVMLLVAGIAALASQNIRVLRTLGMILIIIKPFSIILSAVVGSFEPVAIFSLIIPVMYVMGVETSKE